MKSNQTMMAVGAVIAIVIAIGVLVYFLKPGQQAPNTHPPQPSQLQNVPTTDPKLQTQPK